MNHATLIAPDRLKEFGCEVLQKTGVSKQHAQETAEVLVDANLKGVDTHGIYLCNLYTRRLAKMLFNPKPNFRFEKKRSGVGILDADFSLGQPAMVEATKKAVSLAKDAGVGIVTVKNSNHFGTASYYGEYLASQGCVGIIMSNGECDVIPFGGKEKFFGTDPICCCIPSSSKPWYCMDMATSEVAYGKVRAAAEAGQVIPANWAVDREGNPVTDSSKAYAVVPMSGAKGFALGMMIESLSSRFTGMPYGAQIIRKFDDWENRSYMGHYVQAIDIEAFCSLKEFKSSMDELIKDLKTQPTAPGVKEILIPGEPEWRKKQQRSKNGCPIRKEDFELLTQLGKDFSVPFPAN